MNEMLGVLSDVQIKQRLGKDLIIHPIIHEDSAITGCKVDLHLSGVFYVIQRSSVDSYDPLDQNILDFRREIILPLGQYLVLHPGDLILASTFENVSIPRDLLGMLEGRSSLGRLGVIVHATASFIDPGFCGSITLEVSNLGHLPVKLYTLARVATLALIQISGKIKYAYGDKISDPRHACLMTHNNYAEPISVASLHHKDWEYDIIRKVRDKNRPTSICKDSKEFG